MKTTDDMLRDMRETLAHHESEASRLRAGIAALSGTAPAPAPQLVPWPYPVYPSPIVDPLPPWIVGGVTITCQPPPVVPSVAFDGTMPVGDCTRYTFGNGCGTYLVS